MSLPKYCVLGCRLKHFSPRLETLTGVCVCGGGLYNRSRRKGWAQQYKTAHHPTDYGILWYSLASDMNQRGVGRGLQESGLNNTLRYNFYWGCSCCCGQLPFLDVLKKQKFSDGLPKV